MENSTKPTPVGSRKTLKDKFFEHTLDGWSNHRVLLWLALEETGERDIIEYGMGDGSTRQLRAYAKATKRKLYSYDTHPEWADRFSYKNVAPGVIVKPDEWSKVFFNHTTASVVLIDHNPGHFRKDHAKQWANMDGIMVCHDTEPHPCGGDYKWAEVFPLFKYVVRYQPPFNSETGNWPTGAAAMSNTHDITKWIGQEHYGLKITGL